MEILMTFLFTVGVISFGCSSIGFINVLFESNGSEFEYAFIETYKVDANKLRLLPRVIVMFFIFIIEYSYKLGVFLGKSLKFLIVK